MRVAQEEAVNTTKQQRTHQSAVEIDELGLEMGVETGRS